MPKFTKHLVIHGDIIITAKNKEEAQKKYEETTLLLNQKGVKWDGEQVDEETDWNKL